MGCFCASGSVKLSTLKRWNNVLQVMPYKDETVLMPDINGKVESSGTRDEACCLGAFGSRILRYKLHPCRTPATTPSMYDPGNYCIPSNPDISNVIDVLLFALLIALRTLFFRYPILERNGRRKQRQIEMRYRQKDKATGRRCNGTWQLITGCKPTTLKAKTGVEEGGDTAENDDTGHKGA